MRSAWRKTVTFAFNNHVGDSWDGVLGGGKGRSKEDDSRMQRAARISAALSVEVQSIDKSQEVLCNPAGFNGG